MYTIVSVLLCILILLLLLVLYIKHQRRKESLNNGKMNVFQFNAEFTNYDHSDIPVSPFNDFISLNRLNVVSRFEDANIILFSDYSFIDQNMDNIPFKNGHQYFIYGLKGSDEMASKSSLAYRMKSNRYDAYLPRSYVLDSDEDMAVLEKTHTEGSIYMLKKNIQRQEGNFITNDIDYIVTKSLKDDYVICQELLQNPYCINGRKINIRVYMLITNDKNGTHFYVYKNGFMYYTPSVFQKGSMERDVNITTGYIDRKVYDDNPLTIQEFYTFLGPEKADILSNEIIKTLECVKNTYNDSVTANNTDIPGIKFNIFGADIAPDEDLKTTLMEINKGPDLSFKDERDMKVKLGLVHDCFTMVGLVKSGSPQNFIHL